MDLISNSYKITNVNPTQKYVYVSSVDQSKAYANDEK